MKCHLHRWLLLPLICLLLAACEDDRARRKAAEEARIKREVERRVTVERERLQIHAKRLHTVRVVGLVILTGGALAGLIWLREPVRPVPRSPSVQLTGRRPPLFNHHQQPGRRVFDIRMQRSYKTTSHETPRRS